MAFLKARQRTLAIGDAQLSIVTDDQVYTQGDRLTGKVTLIDRGTGVEGRPIQLELREFWSETQRDDEAGCATTRTAQRTRQSATLQDPVQDSLLEEGTCSLSFRPAFSYPFAFQLPRNARFSQPGSGWLLGLTLDLPVGVERSVEAELHVAPCEEMQAVLEVCRRALRFKEEAEARRWDLQTTASCFQLEAPQALRDRIEGLTLELLQTAGGGLKGSLVLDTQERSVVDYFKAVFSLDEVRRELELSPEQILRPDGSPNRADLVRVIGEALREALG